MNKKISKEYYLLRTKYGFLRHFIKNVFQYKIPKHKKNNIYIFGIPTHTNIGDQAIAVATRCFIQEKLPNKQIIEIPDYAVFKMTKYLKKLDKFEKLNIIFLGGGNMGDSWPQADVYKHDAYRMLPNANFIQFPQSTSFKADGYNLPLVVNDLKSVDSAVIARESLSFEFMKKNFIDTNILFSPDIVLSLDINNDNIERKYITTFLRKDIEKKNDELMTRLNDYVLKKFDNLRVSDTVISNFNGKITEQNREKVFLNKLREFQESKLIITDRLHGMIFACITGTPAIVFDNANHKVKYTYNDWLKDEPHIFFVEEGTSLEDLEKKVQQYLSESKEFKFLDLRKYYQPITDLLNKID